jgi:hypothetical protein
MTRKDYAALAATLKSINSRVSGPVPSGQVDETVANVLAQTFENFDRRKFLEACRAED